MRRTFAFAGRWLAAMGVLTTLGALPAVPQERAAAGSVWKRPAAPAVFWAHDFVDSVGANIHLLHPDSFYAARFELLKQRLLEVGIKHVRDGAMDQHGGFFAGDQAARFRELGKAGIGVTFIFHANVSPAFVQGFPARVSPAFEAYELPNEMNMIHSPPWPAGIQAWMPMFYGYIKNNAATAGYPVIGPSVADLGNDPYSQLGFQADYFDFGNLHKYYRSSNPGTVGYGGFGKPPCQAVRYGSLDYALCNLRRVAGDKAVICTEAGYGTDFAAGRQVTPPVQGEFIARLLLLHLKAGIRRTFLYQFADYGKDGFGAYGLVESDGSPKAGFLELKALMGELADEAQPRPPAALGLTVAGNSQGLENILFEKSDGSYRLLLWLERPVLDPRTGAALEVPEQTVSLSLPAGFRARRLLLFGDSGAVAVRKPPRGAARSGITVPVRSNLVMVDIASSG